MGTHSSGLNGFKTPKNVKLVAKHGDCIEILYNKFLYRVEFNPPPQEEKAENINLKKRVYESSSENEEVDGDESEVTKKSKIENNGTDAEMKDNTVGRYVQKLDDADYLDGAKIVKEQFWEDEDRALLIFNSKGVEGRSKVS